MSNQSLTKEQEDFLEECLLEFSDRYTDSDVEYKTAYETEIPPPPVMYPWFGRPKLQARRNRYGDNYGGYRNHHQHHNNHENWNKRRYDDRDSGYGNHKRFRPS